MIRGSYFKIPIDFDGIIKKQDAINISIDTSIAQHIFLIATTSFGECKFNDDYGTEIWETDFDILKSDNLLKETITNTLKKAISTYEKRLSLEDVTIVISDKNIGNISRKRIKKCVSFSIKGQVFETNRPFLFQSSFFVGPLSY
ncbi:MULTISPECIES: GPW/gp25 family protein [Flavobacterium]|uniref:GPW/gp25 family protein n=1 Tax=Flavobacterium covae TaxID=2906076 RepID=A0ABW8PK23_9FLAO|nr:MULTISPECIES: GPW/gp25 family protein [Flavobacterium]MCH4829583.1 GPW/gp25 family protein [Flavobacterium columnare]MCH4831420.1 GPW/gp25 family protein [Flavobacterium columnare]MCJ1807684.1 GPW/gp25 family protein [Flavobacterium covae]MCJ1808552.1 GPW/gp25 family protein [Flavobacterium covae]QYS91864.1 GPW/gp25 family protein [Flavobacterium covae]